MGRAFLVLAGCLALAALVAAGAPPGFRTTALFQLPSEEHELLTLNLSGAVTGGGAGLASLDVQGVVTRALPDGPGQVEQGTLLGTLRVLDAHGQLLTRTAVEAQYHAQRASYLSSGDDGWLLRIDAGSFALLGSTTGLVVQDGQAAWLVQMGGPMGGQQLTLSGTATEQRQA
jgi:hypothetical protein